MATQHFLRQELDLLLRQAVSLPNGLFSFFPSFSQGFCLSSDSLSHVVPEKIKPVSSGSISHPIRIRLTLIRGDQSSAESANH